MPTYQYPGVYIEEIPSGVKPVEGVATSIAAFVGPSSKGPFKGPTFISSFEDYTNTFGEILDKTDSFGLAVNAFYMNGGKSAFILKVASEKPPKYASATISGLTLTASYEGAWGDDIKYDLTINTVDNKKSFTLALEYKNLKEEFKNIDPAKASTINSSLVKITGTLSTTGTNASGNLAGGLPGAPKDTDYEKAFSALKKIKEISVVVMPGISWDKEHKELSVAQAHCEETKNRVLIIDTPQPKPTDEDPKTILADTNTAEKLGLPTSTYTVCYYPWVKIPNPLYHPEKIPTEEKTIEIAPSALIAGIWSRIDGKRGVWKAPAGVETALIGTTGVTDTVDDLTQAQLNPLGINCIRQMPGYGTVVWGARTLATKADPEWRYVPVRRTAIMIEQSIYNGIQWAVFEPNNHMLWASLRANIGAFMDGLFRSGAFQGEKSSDAYFVRCGLGDTMTQNDIDTGKVIAVVGFAPLKPAEFVIIRIQQKTQQ